MDGWVVIPNWDKFQHYKDRQPAWIKLYTRLAHKPEWEDLSLGARGMLVTIWLEYAAASGRCSVEAVAKQCGRGYKAATLESLNQAGFICLVASKPLALEVRGREETPKPPYVKTAQAPANGRLACPRCGINFKTQARLTDHLEVVHWEDT